MSPNMKLSLLAFVGAAAAIPQYNHGHGHGHKTPSAANGHAYPTGGWSGYNSTSKAVGTGSPKPSSSTPAGEATTDIDYTITSTTTRTVYLTVNTKSAAPTSVGVKDVSSEEPACGPATIYVTATDRVTVTVSASPVPSSSEASSAAPVFPSSPAPKPEIPTTSGYKAATSFVLASSSAPAEKSSSLAPVSSSTPAPEEEAATTSVAPSSVAPVSSVTPSSVAPASSVSASSASASSAPASKPSSAPGYTGGKRGLAYRWDGAADCKSFEGNNFGWAYNWEPDTKGDIGGLAKNFIPTLRTPDGNTAWPAKVDEAVANGAKVVFGYNEPDNGGQTNLGVAELCNQWKANMNTVASKYPDLTIVGPSVSSSANKGQGLDYLSQFVSQCPEAVFHDINIHWYGPPEAGFDAFKAHYQQASSQFGGKRIWVTEFGLTDATPQQSADFLKQAQEFLDGESSCVGYSYFAVGNFDARFNLLGTGSSLSMTGKVYVS